ncbi:MAG TPA: glycerol-3-phosphate dehydrogenase/oxidase [Nannocystaceae bacterium]|nr:glycerol-3-phosphate dehydrogenase/oxidase [Nannocystaceae bacterium]
MIDGAIDEAAAPSWGPAEQRALAERLRTDSRPWDLVVVGAGITGAGIARDAALRGLRVLAIDALDVAYGTSSRSSRLVHGGVRYLEQGEIGLVYEALRERSRLYAAAAHLVRPERFLFPAYAGDRLGPWMLRIGLTLYDTLNFHRGQSHDFLPVEQALLAEPLLARDGLRGAVQYEDAVTDDARLTLAILVDARRHGAEVATYARVERIAGKRHAHEIELDDGSIVHAQSVVVAAGPWTSTRLLGRAGEGLLSLSKGIHLVLRAQDVPVHQPLVIQAPTQKRILFVVPWGARTYLGTTDAPYVGDPGRSGPTEADELELLGLVRRVLPTARLAPERIVSAWSGVRPLVRSADAAPGDTVELSRKHRIVVNDDGVRGIVGGKLTTYRAMAEEIVDEVVGELAKRWPDDRPRPRPCSTHRLPLVPGAPLVAADLDDPLVADLAARHGPAARDLAARARGTAAVERIVADLPYRWCEVDHAIACEGVRHAIDIVRRRLPLVLTDPRQGGAAIREVARRLVDAWGGDAADLDDELDHYRDEVAIETRRTPAIV